MLTTILLEGAPAAAGSGFESLFMIVALIVIFYFFMIRPQNKRRKKINEERAALQKGSKVVTAGGIYGKVKEVRETTFIIEIADGVKITVDKNSIYAAGDADAAQEQLQQKQ